jgi:hypothetical protein
MNQINMNPEIDGDALVKNFHKNTVCAEVFFINKKKA